MKSLTIGCIAGGNVRRALVAATVFVGLWAAGCGEPEPVPKHADMSRECQVTTDARFDNDALRKVHAAATTHGEKRGRAVVSDWVGSRTTDGYRLRSVLSLVLMALAGWLGALLLAAAFNRMTRHRSAARYGDVLSQKARQEAEAIRGLRTRDALKDAIVTRLTEPLAAVERGIERLASDARALEERVSGAAEHARLDAVYRGMERLVGRLEKLHVHLGSWDGTVASASRSLDAELTTAVHDLETALAEVSA